MNIAQRNTTKSGIMAGGYYTADRWLQAIDYAGTWTQTVQSISASDSPVADGVRSSMKTTCASASGALGAGAYNAILQGIEGFNLQHFSKGNSSAKYFALSFWVRTNVVGTYIAELYDINNARTISASYTIAASGTWQKVRLIFPSDSTGAFTNNANLSMQVLFWLGAGSNYTSGTLQTSWATYTANKRATGQVNVGVAVNNYFEITAVQLEPNSVCTPFEVEDIETTRAKCWRYYQIHYQPSMRGVTSNSFNRMMLAYVPMRAQPTGGSNGGSMGFYNGTTAVTGNVIFTASYPHGANTTFEADVASSGWGAGSPAVFYQGAGFTFAVVLDAEFN